MCSYSLRFLNVYRSDALLLHACLLLFLLHSWIPFLQPLLYRCLLLSWPLTFSVYQLLLGCGFIFALWCFPVLLLQALTGYCVFCDHYCSVESSPVLSLGILYYYGSILLLLENHYDFCDQIFMVR